MIIEKFDKFRQEVPLASKKIYLESASTGLIPNFIYNAVRHYIDERYYQGGDSTWVYDDGQICGTLDMMKRSKKAIGKMIGCDASEIFFGNNSSQLFTMIVEGLEFSENDNVVIPKGGWISNRFAWQKKEMEGLKIKYVEPNNGAISLDDIKKVCDENTRVLALTYVESATGYKINAKEIGAFCKEKGIIFAVDAVQALGVLPVDVKEENIDFLVGNDYKWMMNFCGTGYGYIERNLWDKIKHWGVGWMSDVDRFNTQKENLVIRNDAGRFEQGYPTTFGIYGLGLVAEKYNLLGKDDIYQYVMGLVQHLYERIYEIKDVELQYEFNKENRSAIVSLLIKKDKNITNSIFEEKNIIAHVRSFNDEYDLLRISLHYYNNTADVDKFCDVFVEG